MPVKRCYICGNIIQEKAKRCKFCKSYFLKWTSYLDYIENKSLISKVKNKISSYLSKDDK